MTQPPLAPKSRWASLWGGARGDGPEKTAEELRREHAAQDAARAAEAPAERRDIAGRAAPLVQDDEDADGNPIRYAAHTLRVPGYGGLTVKPASDATSAFLGVLALCEKHPEWDPVLTRYGVLVAKLEALPKVAFYVQRSRDGMTLALPDARSRQEALLQLVQALLELQVKHRAEFEQAGVQVFRNG